MMTDEITERLIRLEAKVDTMAGDVKATATTVAVQNGRVTSLGLNQAARVAREEYADKLGNQLRNWIAIAIAAGVLMQSIGFGVIAYINR
jgi:hypothetical protein